MHVIDTRKLIENYEDLEHITKALRLTKQKIVMTIGSWDLLHIGHVRYLRAARNHGDILIIGVDTDETIKYYKGPLRPVVPYEERCEMLTYQACVDFVSGIYDVDENGKWQYGMLEKVRPDVFIAVEDSYPPEQIEDIKKYCNEVVILPRQAENTSTTKLIQHAVKKHLDHLYSMM